MENNIPIYSTKNEVMMIKKGNNIPDFVFANQLIKRRLSFTKKVSQTKLAVLMAGEPIESEPQDAWAKRVESYRKSIGFWERGETTPNIQSLRRLCEVLDCDADYFLNEKAPPRRDVANAAEVTGIPEKPIKRMQIFKKMKDAGLNDYADDLKKLAEIIIWDNLPDAFKRMRELESAVKNAIPEYRNKLSKVRKPDGTFDYLRLAEIKVEGFDKELDQTFYRALSSMEDMLRFITGYTHNKKAALKKEADKVLKDWGKENATEEQS